MASMMLPPSPMDVHQPGLFRIAGFGGAALFLRSGVANAGGPHLVVDVGLLTPDSYVWSLRRPMEPGLSGELARFFFACASEMNPELTVSLSRICCPVWRFVCCRARTVRLSWKSR